MQNEQLHPVQAEPLQAGGNGAFDLPGEIPSRGVDVELGGDARALSRRLLGEPLPDRGLRRAVAVECGGVDPIDARCERAVEHTLALLLRAPDEEPADPSTAEGQGGNLEPGASEASPLHLVTIPQLLGAPIRPLRRPSTIRLPREEARLPMRPGIVDESGVSLGRHCERPLMDKINQRIAAELGVGVAQVAATVELLGEGATVPFIARYRKEKTGGLDDTQLRKLEERLGYLRELEDRRATVLKSIEEQGKLTPELARSINGAETKVELEDLYAPYKPKRRTKAQIAREAGLEPLADALLANPALDPKAEAGKFVDGEKGVADAKAALEGARHILIERMAEEPKLVGELREWTWGDGVLASKVAKGKATEGAKFSDYFDFGQKIKDMPSHRALAMLRGRNEGILDLDLDVPHEEDKPHPAEAKIKVAFNIAERGRPADAWLAETAHLAWKGRMAASTTADLLTRLKERADAEAISVFSRNLKDLLLAAPAGPRATMGLDPGFRTGVKVAVVDATGKLVDTDTIYPHEPKNDWRGALATLAALCMKHKVDLVSVGNGTASRETDKLVAELIAKMPEPQPHQGDGVGGRRLGLFGLRAGGQGVPGRRCEHPRRRLHRAAPAGSAGRAGQDRAQGHRRRPVPARCRPGGPRPLARRRGGGLRQLGGRRREHGLGAAAHARVGPQQDARFQHRRLSRRERRLQVAQRLEEGAAARPQGVRAGGGLPAHHERQEPARCLGRAPGGLSRGGEDRRRRPGGP